jgi:phosphotransferase system  glucose/maltose/N-acetylglucosamine-specific IIC component
METPKIKEERIFYCWLILNLINIIAIFGTNSIISSIVSGLIASSHDPHNRERIAVLDFILGVVGFLFILILSYLVFRFTILKFLLPKNSTSND